VDIAQAHTNYQVSMMAEDLISVINVDKLADITHPVTGDIIGRFTL
jgi:hypothetical protein